MAEKGETKSGLPGKGEKPAGGRAPVGPIEPEGKGTMESSKDTRADSKRAEAPVDAGREARKAEGGRDGVPAARRAGAEGESPGAGEEVAGGEEKTRPGPAQKAAKPHRPLKKKLVAKAGRPKPAGKTDIGIDVRPPARTCSDRNCPFHGRLPVRGLMFEGVVVSDRMDRSAVIERERLLYVPKYERYMKRTSRMSVHNPPCIAAKVGDEVMVMECRPLSKTISFTIVSRKGV